MAEESSSEDELDKLTKSFEQQASEDLKQAAKRHVTSQPQKKKGMKEVTEAGLENPLSESSMGYKMLAKMGYQKGLGLGKNSEGRSEPVNLVIKEKRTGLGVDEDRKRRQEEALANQQLRASKKQDLGNKMQKGFAGLQAARSQERKFEGQLKEARKVVETLDRRKGYEQNFMWPLEEPDADAEEEEKTVGEEEEGTSKQEQSKEPTWEDQPVQAKLVTVLTYLRTHYSYCLHCGCQYASPTDLEQNCPGLMDDDH